MTVITYAKYRLQMDVSEGYLKYGLRYVRQFAIQYAFSALRCFRQVRGDKQCVVQIVADAAYLPLLATAQNRDE